MSVVRILTSSCKLAREIRLSFFRKTNLDPAMDLVVEFFKKAKYFQSRKSLNSFNN